VYIFIKQLKNKGANILSYFETLDKILTANLEDIKKIKGMSEKIA